MPLPELGIGPWDHIQYGIAKYVAHQVAAGMIYMMINMPLHALAGDGWDSEGGEVYFNHMTNKIPTVIKGADTVFSWFF
jgi:hypothetical protein